jgi:cystathionine gamma-synthase
MTKEHSPITRAVRAGIDSDTAFGAVTPPIVLSSTFTFESLGQKRAYDYSRSANPTRDQLGDALAALEGGAGGVIAATGMAAITLVLTALLKSGDRLLIPHDCYGGSWRLFQGLAAKGAFVLDVCDFNDAAAFDAAIARKPQLVWIETPSNPLLRITDLDRTIKAAHAVGAYAVADNTFLTPLLQRPIDFGADAVVHSTTKYINGHSDVVGGSVIARDRELHEQFVFWGNALGLVGSPFDSFLTLRGLRTIGARLPVHQANCARLVEILASHPAVETVYYPGRASHPGHDIAARQQKGFGAMLSFDLAGGDGAVRAFLDGLRLFSLAGSLGGVESLVAHPATMTNAAMSAEDMATAGIKAGLLRISVGIEDGDDLAADLAAGLDRAARISPQRDACR